MPNKTYHGKGDPCMIQGGLDRLSQIRYVLRGDLDGCVYQSFLGTNVRSDTTLTVEGFQHRSFSQNGRTSDANAI
jgi:hypothetical protein